MNNIVNLDREEDIDTWLLNDENVYVGRSTRIVQVAKWGNPFKLNKNNSRQQVLDLYKKYVLSEKELTESLSELAGKVLGCHCAPDLCHAEVLHKLAGNTPIYKQYVFQSYSQQPLSLNIITMDSSDEAKISKQIEEVKDRKKNEKPL